MQQHILKRICPFILLLAFLAPPTAGMLNPAAVYCGALGYRYVTESTLEGDFGYCILPDGTKADSWEFFGGVQGKEYGACARSGYRQEPSSDPTLCPFAQCAVCILPAGTLIPADILLNLRYEETSCGDGTCGTGEDAIYCPLDCRSGDMDNLCDGIRDNRCDPDCPDGLNDPDCGGVPWEGPELIYIAVLTVLAIAGASIYLFLTRKRSS
jgi:hypothetical protein